MRLKQLEYFMAAAEAKSISLAARKLYMAQPPVSRQISLLEEELGVDLFKRTNKGISLTPAGLSLFRQAKDLFSDINHIVDSVKNHSSGSSGQIKIGTIASNVPYITKNLKGFVAQYPNINIYLRTDTPQALVDDLENGNLNIIFIRKNYYKNPNFSTIEIAKSQIELIMHKSLDPNPNKREVNLKDLNNIPMCTLRTDDIWGYSELFLEECHKVDSFPKIVCECYDTPSIMSLVQAGIGVAFLPKMLLNNMCISDEVYSKPVKDLHIESPTVIMWTNDAYLSSSVKLFLSLFGYNKEKNEAGMFE
ncbi:MAG: LysR family transcriptional regulator [Eubacteriales bacterium]|nr:LysR family transcriptional regulator [Eubacteriales bacterium]